MRRLLVTGGAGFIGSNFIRYWVNRYPDDRLVNLDALTYAGNLENLADIESAPGYRFVHADITDRSVVERLLEEEAIDTVVNFAAESHVDRSILGPEAFIRTNVHGTFTLLEAARTVWKGFSPGLRFLHVSTDEVYGSLAPDEPPFTETHGYAPNSPYSASKAASDHLVRAYHRTYGMPVLTTNCSNNYGPFQFPEKLIPLVIINAVRGESLPVYGKGENVRDWLYVDDHARALWTIATQGRLGETYNVGGASERRNLEVVETICDTIDRSSPADDGKSRRDLIAFVEDRPGHDLRYAIDFSKLEKELGWTPLESFESGLEKTVDWYLSHRDWWEDILQSHYDGGRLGQGRDLQ